MTVKLPHQDMDIQSDWQAGILDVDGKLYEYLCEYFKK